MLNVNKLYSIIGNPSLITYKCITRNIIDIIRVPHIPHLKGESRILSGAGLQLVSWDHEWTDPNYQPT